AAAGAGGRAVALTRAVTCPSWIVRVSCDATVVGRFAAPAPATSGSMAPALSAAQLCERSLAEALAGEQIEFGSGSAAIGTRSGALLDRLAREVRGCPGVMRIDGHTDTVGRGRFNRGLSEARAAAVRDALVARGVPAERLRTRGFAPRRASRGRSAAAHRGADGALRAADGARRFDAPESRGGREAPDRDRARALSRADPSRRARRCGASVQPDSGARAARHARLEAR